MKRIIIIVAALLATAGTAYAIRWNIGPSIGSHRINVGPSQDGGGANGPVGWF